MRDFFKRFPKAVGVLRPLSATSLVFSTKKYKNAESTVDVQNPDVWISAFSKSVRFSNVRISDVRLKSGQYCPVIGRPVHLLYTL